MHKRLHTELPGKILPPLPKKNKSSSTTSGLLGGLGYGGGDDRSSMSSVSTTETDQRTSVDGGSSLRGLLVPGKYMG